MYKNMGLILLLVLAGCGGGGGGGSHTPTGRVSLNVTDAPVDTAARVVITVDKVSLRRDGAADVVIDRFTIPSLSLSNSDSFQIDLLDYRYGARALIVNNLEVPAASYSQLILHVLDDDVNLSYVEMNDGTRTPIKLPSDELKLGGFSGRGGCVQFYVGFRST